MPAWLNTAVFYEIYPQTFLDTNGDGVGDIPGIIKKLDYIKDLGCNAIWLNPCFDSPFWDAGYDVRDYKKVAPRYGTNEDLYELFNEAHRRDMHIILDLVPGHTSIDHPWFLEASRHLSENSASELASRYIFTNSVWDLPDGYRWVSGYAERDGNFMVNFFSTQPALNYGFFDITDPSWQKPPEHPDCIATLAAITDVMRFWLDRGADGFRVDMADSLVKNDDEKIATCKLWRSVRAMLDEKYPEAVIVSEWSHPERAINMAGFHLDFLLDHVRAGYHNLLRRRENGVNRSYISRDGGCDVMPFVSDFVPKYEATRGNGYISFITCNHDTPRLTRHLSTLEIKLAYAIIFTLPGVPFIYYGDEIGMRFIEDLPSKEGGYGRTGTRTPMQWDSSLNRGFSDADSAKLYLPVDTAPDAPTVEAQQNDPDSIYALVKKLLALRSDVQDLQADGDFEVVNAVSGNPVFAYRRGSCYIFVNPGTREAAADFHAKTYTALFQIGSFAVEHSSDGGRITLGAQSFALLQV